LSERADAFTDRNLASAPAKPPAVAAASPLHELLVRELAESLPQELRSRLEAEPSVARVMDWLAAGALFRWVQHDTPARRAFLASVMANPEQAALALARAMSARMEPPPRDAAWRAADRLGLIKQLLFAAGVLAARGSLFAGLGWIAGLSPFVSGESFLLSFTGLRLIIMNQPHDWLGLAVLGVAGGWLVWEAVHVPILMERLRQAPARARQLAPPRSWRLDTFTVAWVAQALILLALLSARFGITAWAATTSTWLRLVALIGCLLVPLIAFLAARAVAPVFPGELAGLRLGPSVSEP
jgi:hypothetical protein